MSLDSSIADTSLGIASLFNKFFYSVYSSASTTDVTPPAFSPEDSLSSIDITTHDTFKVLSTLDSKKAMGGDCIPQGAATALTEPLHHVFNLCVKNAVIPSEWHDHVIIPIPKSGDKTLISNYRPISLLTSVSKVFEKLVFKKVVDYLTDSTVSHFQFGFLSNRSTVKQLLLHVESITDAKEHHQQLDTVMLDISKAFDSVPPQPALTPTLEMCHYRPFVASF